jgi:MFS family permease
MYQVENTGDLLRNRTADLRSRLWPTVGANVFLLGLTSLLTDVSVEMVTTVLPLYMLVGLRLAPLQLGVIDGLYQGAAALVQVASGLLADRWRRPKGLATTGYAFSAVCKLGFLLTGANWMILSGIVVLDRIGKGIRTSPRDALIAASAPRERLGTAFGVHRAMDTAGAMLGPLVATLLLVLTANQFETVFVVSFCFAVSGLSVIVFLVKDGKPSSCPAAHVVSSIATVRHLLRERAFRNIVFASSALAVVTMSDSLIYLTVRRSPSARLGTFPMLFVGAALVFMLLAVPMGRLADRIGRRVVFGLGYGVLVLVYGALLAPSSALSSIWAVIGLGFYYAATDGVLMAHASALLPDSVRATGLAIVTTGSSIGRLCASVAFGTLWQWWGPEVATRCFVAGLLLVLTTVGMAAFSGRGGRAANAAL